MYPGLLEWVIHLFDLRGQLWILGPAHRWQFPVVDTVPPPADSASQRVPAERGIAVPEAPAGERECPDCALDEREEDLQRETLSAM